MGLMYKTDPAHSTANSTGKGEVWSECGLVSAPSLHPITTETSLNIECRVDILDEPAIESVLDLVRNPCTVVRTAQTEALPPGHPQMVFTLHSNLLPAS